MKKHLVILFLLASFVYLSAGNLTTKPPSSAIDLACSDCVALTTETSGNYVTSISVSSPLSCTGCTAAEGGTPALSFTFSGASAYKGSGTQNITGGNTDGITLDTEWFDTDTYHSTSSNTDRATPPSAGYYTVICGAFLVNPANAEVIYTLFRYNSSDVAQEQSSLMYKMLATDANPRVPGISKLMHFDSGDYASCKVNPSANITIQGAVYSTGLTIKKES